MKNLKKRELIYILTLAVTMSFIFSGLHTFTCILLGFLWGHYLYAGIVPNDYTLFRKWKMSYHRYSFVKFIKNIDQKLNEHFNPNQSSKISSVLRIAPPTILFLLVNSLLPFFVEWYFVFLGALAFEVAKMRMHFRHF